MGIIEVVMIRHMVAISLLKISNIIVIAEVIQSLC